MNELFYLISSVTTVAFIMRINDKIRFISLKWVKLSAGTYQKLEIQFVDQNLNSIPILDNNVCISLRFCVCVWFCHLPDYQLLLFIQLKWCILYTVYRGQNMLPVLRYFNISHN